MNNFPAMTEEQRQEFIADCKADIEWLEIQICRHGGYSPAAIRDLNSRLARQQCALAALTAEPEAWAHRLVNKHNGVVHPWVYGSAEASASEGDIFRIEVMKLFTALPAPVLRVQDGWIKCSERYPEVGQEVLIRIPVCEKFNIENGKYEGDGQFLGAWFDKRGKGRPYKVTHWMPLPPPETSNEQ